MKVALRFDDRPGLEAEWEGNWLPLAITVESEFTTSDVTPMAYVCYGLARVEHGVAYYESNAGRPADGLRITERDREFLKSLRIGA